MTKRQKVLLFMSALLVLALLLNVVIPGQPVACIWNGNHWGVYGLGGSPACNEKTSDAGKACTSSQQCEGSCISELELPAGTEAVGVCSAWTILEGYNILVENGRVRLTFID